MTLSSAQREEVRLMVNDALHELLPATAEKRSTHGASAEPPPPATAATGNGPHRAGQGAVASMVRPPLVEDVSLTTDAELTAFVNHLLARAADRGFRDDVRSGRTRFRLSTRSTSPVAAGGRRIRVDKGVVTEAMVNRAAGEGAVFSLGPRAVPTPLALDRARELGLRMERDR